MRQRDDQVQFWMWKRRGGVCVSEILTDKSVTWLEEEEREVGGRKIEGG